MRDERTNVAREHEEVIVRQTSVLLGIDERLDVNSITLLVLVLEDLKSLGEVQGIGRSVGHGVSVGNGHDGRKVASRGTEKCI